MDYPRRLLPTPPASAGRPEDSGISLEIVEKLGPLGFPVFGVCMGHQCIGQVFGGNVVRAPSGVMHGKTSPVFHTSVGLLEGLDNPFKAARYHSLVIDKESCPEELEVTAWWVGWCGPGRSQCRHTQLRTSGSTNSILLPCLALPSACVAPTSLLLTPCPPPAHLAGLPLRSGLPTPAGRCEDGTIMGVRHRAYPHIQGVQFHPESIITDNGMRIVRNFVESLG